MIADTMDGVGAPVRRREDLRLLRGTGAYSDDINLPDQLYAAMVRSPHAHALLSGIDATAALKMSGVTAVLTGADYVADGIADIGHTANPAGAVDWQNPAFVNRDGSVPFDVPQPTIVRDKVRHAGEIVAVVIAETDAIAARGSIWQFMTRLLKKHASTTCAASANAASVASESPSSASTGTLPGHPSQTLGASSANAARRSARGRQIPEN